MTSTVIGCGAAGTKALITLIEKGVVSRNSAHIVNSTLRDVPKEYKDIALIISEDDRVGGCGKEREQGKALMLEYIKNHNFDVSELLNPNDETCTIIAAPEGGTGSGASVVLAEKISEFVPVHIFMLNGFEDDPRGIKNTINYFKDLSEEYVVEAISNKKFLRDTGSRLRAEAAANNELADRLMIYLGNPIVESAQNIDPTDHYKIITRPGFMDVEIVQLEKVKNLEQMTKILQDAIDNTHSIDFTPSAGIIAVYINASDKTADLVTASFDLLKENFGVPFEIFHHIQYEGDNEWCAIIASGMKLPIEEVEAIYKKYIKESNRVDKSSDTFFGSVGKLTEIEDDDMFNINDRRRRPGAGNKTPEPKQDNKGFQGTRKQTVKLVERSTKEDIDEY